MKYLMQGNAVPAGMNNPSAFRAILMQGARYVVCCCAPAVHAELTGPPLFPPPLFAGHPLGRARCAVAGGAAPNPWAAQHAKHGAAPTGLVKQQRQQRPRGSARVPWISLRSRRQAALERPTERGSGRHRCAAGARAAPAACTALAQHRSGHRSADNRPGCRGLGDGAQQWRATRPAHHGRHSRSGGTRHGGLPQGCTASGGFYRP